MKLIRAAIWIATGLFVFLLFYPLVLQMWERFSVAPSALAP